VGKKKVYIPKVYIKVYQAAQMQNIYCKQDIMGSEVSSNEVAYKYFVTLLK